LRAKTGLNVADVEGALACSLNAAYARTRTARATLRTAIVDRADD
jgi:hypothetical protein